MGWYLTAKNIPKQSLNVVVITTSTFPYTNCFISHTRYYKLLSKNCCVFYSILFFCNWKQKFSSVEFFTTDVIVSSLEIVYKFIEMWEREGLKTCANDIEAGVN